MPWVLILDESNNNTINNWGSILPKGKGAFGIDLLDSAQQYHQQRRRDIFVSGAGIFALRDRGSGDRNNTLNLYSRSRIIGVELILAIGVETVNRSFRFRRKRVFLPR